MAEADEATERTLKQILGDYFREMGSGPGFEKGQSGKEKLGRAIWKYLMPVVAGAAGGGPLGAAGASGISYEQAENFFRNTLPEGSKQVGNFLIPGKRGSSLSNFLTPGRQAGKDFGGGVSDIAALREMAGAKNFSEERNYSEGSTAFGAPRQSTMDVINAILAAGSQTNAEAMAANGLPTDRININAGTDPNFGLSAGTPWKAPTPMSQGMMAFLNNLGYGSQASAGGFLSNPNARIGATGPDYVGASLAERMSRSREFGVAGNEFYGLNA